MVQASYVRKPAKCPKCKSPKIATIRYGMPAISEDFFAKLDSGKIVLGGCVIEAEGSQPSWQCIDCGTDYFKTLSPAAIERRKLLRSSGFIF